MIARLILFIVVVSALAALAMVIADEPGRVTIVWGDYLIELTPAALVGAAALLSVLAMLFYQLARWLIGGPGAYAKMRAHQRERRGYRALTLGLVAIAAGDPKSARRLAKRANALLDEPPLTLLLSAQSAQLEGREALAKDYFEAMLERPETAFLGLRGLIVQAVKAGDSPRARALAERAYRLRPDTPWVMTTLLDLRTRAGNWKEARQLLERAGRHDVLDDRARRRRAAALYLEEARAARAAGELRAALRLAERAQAQDGNFLPAPILAAECALALGKRGRAQRVAEVAWRETPHPALAATVRGLVASAGPKERTRALARLAAANPSHPESHALLAHSALEAGDFTAARAEAEALIAKRPSAGAYLLMARIEQARHQSEAAHAALLQASRAPSAGPLWQCGRCATRAPDWTLACPACGALDAMDWPREAGGMLEPSLSEAVGQSSPAAIATPEARSGTVAVRAGAPLAVPESGSAARLQDDLAPGPEPLRPDA